MINLLAIIPAKTRKKKRLLPLRTVIILLQSQTIRGNLFCDPNTKSAQETMKRERERERRRTVEAAAATGLDAVDDGNSAGRERGHGPAT